MNRRRRALLAALAGGAVSPTGCAILAPVPVDERSVLIAEGPARVPRGTPHPGTLLVFAPETAAVYDTTRIAYATRPYEIAYFNHVEWAARPAQMIHPLLVSALRATRTFGAVEAPPYAEHYSYSLRTEIQELRQDFAARPAVLRLAMHARLAGEDSGRTLLERDFAVAQALGERTPAAGVAAANHAAAKLIGELAASVVQALA